MKYYSTKTFGNELGLSCCFRQWKATHSHCSLLHGYSIGVKLVFECEHLDSTDWVFDFGGLKQIKSWLLDTFDHRVVLSEDDPELEMFKKLNEKGNVINLKVLPGVGCEKFAELIFNKMEDFIIEGKEKGEIRNPSVRTFSVEVFEHGANSAIYSR